MLVMSYSISNFHAYINMCTKNNNIIALCWTHQVWWTRHNKNVPTISHSSFNSEHQEFCTHVSLGLQLPTIFQEIIHSCYESFLWGACLWVHVVECICLCACMCVRMCVHVRVLVHVCPCVCVCACGCVHTRLWKLEHSKAFFSSQSNFIITEAAWTFILG